MWLIRLKGGLEVTEHELECWDNVPAGADIEALALSIPRENAPPYTIEYKGYEEYCCARIASCPQGGGHQVVGYEVLAVKNGMVLEHDILPHGMRLNLYRRDVCEVPDHCFRRGVS